MSWDDSTEQETVIEIEEVSEDDRAAALGEAAPARQPCKRCEQLEEELGRAKEMYLRKLADFDNYRKRQERELDEFRRLANAALVRDLLPVLDNLERALASAGPDASGLRVGVELILKQLKDVLGRSGLQEVDPVGQLFDPSKHEAIQRRDVPGLEDVTVVQVLQKGYLMGDRLLRPALVVAGVPVEERAPEAAAEPTVGAAVEPAAPPSEDCHG